MLKQRTERLFAFHDLNAIQTTLDALISRGLAQRLARRPGQKEERYRQLLGGTEADEAELAPGSGSAPAAATPTGADSAAPAATRPVAEPPPGSSEQAAEPLAVPADTPETERIEKLEREVSELRQDLENLKDQLGA